MAIRLSVSAPAKLVILGEYAVLEGASALVQAVDRFAQIHVKESSSAVGHILAKPLFSEPLAYRFDHQGQFHWLNEQINESLPFVKPLMNDLGPWARTGHVGVNSGGDKPGENKCLYDIELDTSAFFANYQGERRKLGLGSSAALAVALAAAWYSCRHDVQHLDKGRWLPTLVNLHRKLQGGKGSGVDVAASLYGGLLEYNMGAADSTDANSEGLLAPTAANVSMPPDLEWMWIWLGKAASTREFLSGMKLYQQHRQDSYFTQIKDMAGISQNGIRAAKAGDADALLACIQDYGLCMQRLGEAAQVPIYTDDHRRLAQLAQKFNVAFKPSGAGGGDIALAASRDTEALSDLARQVTAAGYPVVPLGPATHGLTIRSGSE